MEGVLAIDISSSLAGARFVATVRFLVHSKGPGVGLEQGLEMALSDGMGAVLGDRAEGVVGKVVCIKEKLGLWT